MFWRHHPLLVSGSRAPHKAEAKGVDITDLFDKPACLRLGQALGLTHYGPEQLIFLRYRPVPHHWRIKEEFGYYPVKSTRQVFDLFLEARRHG